ncbi:S-layer family protein [Tumebacillus sp. BK434]|uniref:S-layer homology domain-containing protein n=1 Tax=Tumebacillus sp. BK434 TaxID=2512169 RepID=UPI00104D3761|nr:S-layer homology domain-containing protein [Tumebacillus sp. BK434]TCP52470.1 S-layer family protein [Tumebacillus sp. BK434]
MATPILGTARATVNQMRTFLRRVNSDAPDYSQLYLDIGTRYRVRGDLAFAQSIHETGYWQFRGTVRPYQNNFSGLGTVNPDVQGATFATPALGIEAQIQHLYGYATRAPLPAGVKVVDPRFAILERAGLRGVAPTWEQLNGRWAVPGINYGQSIVELWQQILQMQAPGPLPTPSAPPQPDDIFIDLDEALWAEPFIRQAAELGLIQGYEDRSFRPNRELTRAELAVILTQLREKLRG